MEYAAAECKMGGTAGDTLKIAEYVSNPINIVDHSGTRHVFRKFCLLGHWGVCNSDRTQILIAAKSTYATVEILVYTQLIVLGNLEIGWDVYSLEGKFLESLPPMSMANASLIINAKKRSNY